jgi:hypothetical protein
MRFVSVLALGSPQLLCLAFGFGSSSIIVRVSLHAVHVTILYLALIPLPFTLNTRPHTSSHGQSLQVLFLTFLAFSTNQVSIMQVSLPVFLIVALSSLSCYRCSTKSLLVIPSRTTFESVLYKAVVDNVNGIVILILVDLAELACARVLRELILHGERKHVTKNVIVFRN